MSQKTRSSRLSEANLDRRRLMQGMAAAGVASVAGCIDLSGDDGGPDIEGAQQRRQVDVADLPSEPSGTLKFALQRGSIASYDPANSTEADDGLVFNAVYEVLRRQDLDGEFHNWLAQDFEVVDSQSVDVPGDYTDYMEGYEITAVEDGEGNRLPSPVLDVERPNLVLMEHPDDVEAYGNEELGVGDEFRVLTREEAGDAVADGVYGMQLDITLREGAEFSNGEELTAENIVRSYDRFVGGRLEGQQFNSLFHAEATDGQDGYEVSIYAREPDAEATTGIIPFDIFPSDHFDIPPGELDPRNDGPVPVGLGPYEIDDFESDQFIRLTLRDNYFVDQMGLDSFDWWDGSEDFPTTPLVETIEFTFVQEQGTRVAQIQDGTIDGSHQLPPEQYSSFQETDGFDVSAAPGTGYLFMHVPVDVEGPLGERPVRQAIQQLIPRQTIVDVVADGWAAPAQLPFPEPASKDGTAVGYDTLAEEDWAYPVEPEPDAADSLVGETDLETPIDMTFRTNSDDATRANKVELIVDEVNQTDSFTAEIEEPAALNDWFVSSLIQPDSRNEFAENNATATFGLAGGFQPDGYARAVHHPDNYKICCNLFHPQGTFEFEDAIDEARFGVDVVDDPELRRERYDQLWEDIANAVGNTYIDFSLTVTVMNDRVKGYNAFADRRFFFTYGVYAPYEGDGQIAYIEDEE